ncbi:hypothetical protein STEG23_009877, partial [Scotinomys teguina]
MDINTDSTVVGPQTKTRSLATSEAPMTSWSQLTRLLFLIAQEFLRGEKMTQWTRCVLPLTLASMDGDPYFPYSDGTLGTNYRAPGSFSGH